MINGNLRVQLDKCLTYPRLDHNIFGLPWELDGRNPLPTL